MKQLEELLNAISEINLSSSPIDEIRVKADALNRPRKERAETERDAALAFEAGLRAVMAEIVSAGERGAMSCAIAGLAVAALATKGG